MRVKSVLLLMLTGILFTFLMGCGVKIVEENISIQSPLSEIEDSNLNEFIGSLNETNTIIGIELLKIQNEYTNFDEEYNWVKELTEYNSITEGMVNDMGEYSEKIRNSTEILNTTILGFEQKREKIDLGALSDNQLEQTKQIEEKIILLTESQEEINNCEMSLLKYNEFVSLLRKKLIRVEDLSDGIDSASNNVDLEEYDEAIKDTERNQRIAREVKSTNEKMSDLGIVEYDEDVLGSWDLFVEALEEYKKYIESIQNEDYDDAWEYYDSAYNKMLNALQAGKENTTLINDEIDAWYSKNIKQCIDLYEGIIVTET